MILLHPASATSPDRDRQVQLATGLLPVLRGRRVALITPGEPTMKLIIKKHWDDREIVVDAADVPDLQPDFQPVDLLGKWLLLDHNSLDLESGDTITIE